MGSKEFRNVYITYNDKELGFFKEIVINSNEVRLYNPNLIRVFTFDTYSPLFNTNGVYKLVFNGDDNVADIEYQEKPEEDNPLKDILEVLDRFNEAHERIEEEQTTTKPSHYFQNGIMAWDIIGQAMKFYGDSIDGLQGFYLGNIFKYLLRFLFKGQAVDDLNKIKVYIDEIMKGLNEDN